MPEARCGDKWYKNPLVRLGRHGARRARIGAALVVLAAAAAVPSLRGDEVKAADVVEIRTLSNRADLISGGTALVEALLPGGTDPETTKVTVGDRDVTSAFAVRGTGRYAGRFVGLVDGLTVGPNELRVTRADGSGARLTITNHPIGGPVFAGPQIQPWTCIGESTDAQCNRPPTVEFLYMPEGGGGFQPYDPENPPDDVAETETDNGQTVPFIVRHEIGVIDRDEYRIAVLYDPAKPWQPWAPQPQFNHKLVVFHGASCDTHYQMADAPDVLNEMALGLGFATMSHALNNSGHNCHVVVQAESMLMAKEHLIESLGEIRYTIGSGCSGGALAQQWVANAYPGFYQGITPACSFTDSFSSGMQREDYTLLRKYFEVPDRWAPGVLWTLPQIQQVYDHPNVTNPITFTEVIPPNADPSRDCVGVPPENVYHHETNPDGVRCSIQDYMVNVFGRRPDRKAGRAADNVGIQYGLRALEEGALPPSHFVDVNVKVGSHDIDYEHQLIRRQADRPALERAFASGAVNSATNMDEVAIIDLRGPDPGAFHDVYRTYAMRERLMREHGTAANQLLWRGQIVLLGDTSFTDDSILAMDQWLAAIEQDTRDVPLVQKIIEDRPETVTDRCTDGTGNDVDPSVCDATVQSYGAPRFQAGMPLADDTIKCQLKPHRRDDYGVTFTDEEWAALDAVFPNGVCDYTQPSVAKTPTVPWMTYADTVGGRPMGDPPTSVAFAGASPARAPVRPAAPAAGVQGERLAATGDDVQTSVAVGVLALLALSGIGVIQRRVRG